MDENQKREEKRKLKELRRELEEKIKGIIPEALKARESFDIVSEKIEESIELDEKAAKQVIEALLFASSRQVTAKEIAKIVKPYTPSQIIKIVYGLKDEYVREERSFRINEVAGGFEISTLPHYAPWISKLEKEKKAKQASLAALETLAILAYKQPITRVEIEEIRGVDASGVIATLLDKGFIAIVGRKEVPGRPLLYGTTEPFLEHFGLKSINDLPDIEEIKTLVEDTIRKEELLRKENVVTTVADDEESVGAVQDEFEEATAQIAVQFDEIADQISNVKVKSERQISEILNPQLVVDAENGVPKKDEDEVVPDTEITDENE